jgi:hypothetical protein
VTCDGSNWKLIAFITPKDNYSSASDPSVTNDGTEGYSLNSVWFNQTSKEAWRCFDITTGAAVWEKTTLTADELNEGAFLDRANTTEAQTGTAHNLLITPLTLKEVLDVSVIFSEEFISAEQVITSSGSLTIAHGLSSAPKIIQLELICKTAQAGYSVGDIVFINPHYQVAAAASQGVAFQKDATNLIGRYASTSTVFSIIDKTTGIRDNITNSNWRLIVSAWG